MPGVRDHAGKQIFSEMSKHPEKNPIHGDDDGGFSTLIDVTSSKSGRRKKNCRRNIGGPGKKLPLQVTPEDNFLTDAGGEGSDDPQKRFQWSLWKQKSRFLQISRHVKH